MARISEHQIMFDYTTIGQTDGGKVEENFTN